MRPFSKAGASSAFKSGARVVALSKLPVVGNSDVVINPLASAALTLDAATDERKADPDCFSPKAQRNLTSEGFAKLADETYQKRRLAEAMAAEERHAMSTTRRHPMILGSGIFSSDSKSSIGEKMRYLFGDAPDLRVAEDKLLSAMLKVREKNNSATNDSWADSCAKREEKSDRAFPIFK